MTLKGYKWVKLSEALKELPEVSSYKEWEKISPHNRGLWCAWHYGLSFAQAIEDCIVISHAPLQCQSSRNKFFGSLGYRAPFASAHTPCTNMNNQHVILGGEEQLERTILEVDRDYRPALIWVGTSCASELNMDDVQGITERLQPKVKAKLYWSRTPGFGATWPSEMGGRYLVPMVEDLMEEPDKIDKTAVNIVGVRFNDCNQIDPHLPEKRKFKMKWGSNSQELARIIEALGLKLHRVVLGGTYSYFKTAPQAAVNTVDCSDWGWPIAETMEKKFGTPWLPEGRTLGVEATTKWITDLAKFMGVEKQAGRFIDHEYGQIKDVWEKAKKLAKGKIALVEGSRSSGYQCLRPIVVARLAMDLGMTPYVFNVHPANIKAKESIFQYLIKVGVDPMYLLGPYEYQKTLRADEVMKDLGLSPDEVVYFYNDAFAYGNAPLWDAATVAHTNPNGRPHRRVVGAARDAGFPAAGAYAEDVIEAIQAVRGNKPLLRPTLYGRIFGKSFDFEYDTTIS